MSVIQVVWRFTSPMPIQFCSKPAERGGQTDLNSTGNVLDAAGL